MKKLIGTLVAAMLAAAVFADVGVGAWGRGIWAPFAYVDGEATMLNMAGWGWGGPRVGMSFSGSSDNMGFSIAFKADGGTPAITDNTANIWTKPWDWLKITIGSFFDDTLRGNTCFVSWDWLRPAGNWNGCYGEDLTFARIYDASAGAAIYSASESNSMAGALLSLTPVEGLYIAAGFNVGYTASDTDNLKEIADIFKTSQYQAGYTIADIMAIKAQWIGHGDWGEINAAVDLLMVENNKISIGAYIPTDKAESDIGVAAGYNGSFEAVSLGAFVATRFPSDENGKTFQLHIGVGFGYDLGDGMAIEADVRANMKFPKDNDAAGDVSVGAYFSKGFSNGKCGVGVIADIGINEQAGFASLVNKDADNKVNIAIPIKLEYWF